MANNDAPDVSRSPRARGVRERLIYGLGSSLGGNATAFGYSVTITASFGAVELGRGTPRFGDLIVFGLGAVVAFGGLEGLASGGFRSPLQKGSNEVVLLGTALAFISIVLAIATARGIAEVLSGAWAWFGAAFGASLAFALVESVEFMLPNGCRNAAASPLSLTISPGHPASTTSRDHPDHRRDHRRQSPRCSAPRSVIHRPHSG